MHVDEVAGASPGVQRVDVPCDERDRASVMFFEAGQSLVRRIRLDTGGDVATPGIEAQDRVGVAREGLRRGDVLGVDLCPDAFRTRKCVVGGVRRQAGAREDDDAIEALDAVLPRLIVAPPPATPMRRSCTIVIAQVASHLTVSV